MGAHGRGSKYLIALSWRLRPVLEQWMSSQVRPWSSRLRWRGDTVWVMGLELHTPSLTG